MAIVIIEGKAHPIAVAEVAPLEVVEKLRLGAIAVHASSAVAPISQTAPPRTVSNEQIVVLCRDPRVRDLVATWLTQSGQSVRIAENGWDAYRALSSNVHNTQALIIDKVLPPWPGIEPIRNLKKSMPLLKVVLIQDCSDEGTDMADEVGADVSIERPLHRFDLLDALDLAA